MWGSVCAVSATFSPAGAAAPGHIHPLAPTPQQQAAGSPQPYPSCQNPALCVATAGQERHSQHCLPLLVTPRTQHVLVWRPQPCELIGCRVLPGLMAQHEPRRRAETGKISYAQTLLNDLANSSFPSLFVPEYILFVSGKVSS